MGIFSAMIDSSVNYQANQETNHANKEIANENLKYQREANEANLQYMREANAQNEQLQRDINNQNIAMQRETNQLNENLMREQWGREDTSYQRTITDMQAVGLSPLAMSGLNGGGGLATMGSTETTSPQVNALHEDALHNDMKYERPNINVDLEEVETFNAIKNAVNSSRKLNLEEAEIEKRENRLNEELDEQKRHNLATESAQSWKNKLANRAIDVLEKKLLNNIANGTSEPMTEDEEWDFWNNLSKEEQDAYDKIFNVREKWKKEEQKRIKKKADEYKQRYGNVRNENENSIADMIKY